ncbi:guanylate kinase [Saccharobesus litoralis]|uniref:Guanylate kinase n=1 Tax=Saccharobesus litoralis TaxID=2172099 RepID=A0A2S0VRI4_9ALTE|nr:guanylate kinase [Saccharobesus litoralis]AWB66813.1 guanylate kinase [Saccharobesus litoralis]
MSAIGTLYVVSAPSGAGKSSLIKAYLEQQNDKLTGVSVSHTTREPRPGEENGKHYHFVTQDEFKQLIEQQAFFEWAEVFGNFYGTSKLAIDEQLNNGIDVFLDIDWQGARQVKQAMPQSKTIFILPPSKAELERRLTGRGQDSAETIAKRMDKAQSEMSHFNEFDYVIINDDFDQALSDMTAILRAERTKQTKQAKKYHNLLQDLLA